MEDNITKYKLLKAEREKGLVLQQSFPYVRTFYRAGLSERIIAELIYDNSGLCQELGFDRQVSSINSLANIVRRSLVGNNREMGDDVPLYAGLLSTDEYKDLSKQHRQAAAKKTHDVNTKNKKGALHLTREELSQAGRNANMARGLTAWTEEERATARQLSAEGYIHLEIAPKLNELYHQGKTVRTKSAVDNLFHNQKPRRLRAINE